jgi:hypothetical protein
MDSEVVLRVAVERAPAGPGVVFGLQDKAGQVVDGVPGPGARLMFETRVRVTTDGSLLNFLGPFTHGPKANRHLYLSHGRTGAEGWIKRIKLPLTSITKQMVATASDRAIETVVDGRSAATVRTEWRVGQAGNG